MPGGDAGDLLRLVPMHPVREGWDKDQAKWIESLEPNSVETGWWSGVGQRIRQICFAHLSNEQLTFLAVRTASTISIFAPLCRTSAVASTARATEHGFLPPSRFDPNYMFALSTEQLGQSPPVDMSFNPWQQRKFAVVSQQGYWSIWELRTPTGRANARNLANSRDAGRVKAGQIPKVGPEESKSKRTFQDGWHRIMWVANQDTIIICSRTAFTVYDLASEHFTVETSRLRVSENAAWLLDVRQHPTFNDHLFVTTTSQILWLRVVDIDNTVINQGQNSRIQVLLSWVHFRDPGDTSLHSTTFKDGNETVLFLYSHINSLITAFRFKMDGKTSIPVSVTDPVRVLLPSALLTQFSSGRTSSPIIDKIAIYPVQYREKPLVGHLKRLPGTWDEYKTRGERFYKVLIQQSNLSVRSLLYRVVSGAQGQSKMLGPVQSLKIQQPTWKRLHSLSAQRLLMEEFAVPDGLLMDDDEDVVKPYKSPHWRQWLNQFLRADESQADKLLESPASKYTRLYARILADAGTSTQLQNSLTRIRAEAIQRDQGIGASVVKLWSDYLTLLPRVDNINEITSMLQGHLRSQHEAIRAADESSLQVIASISGNTLNLSLGAPRGTPDLSTAYTEMKTNWIDPMAANISELSFPASDRTAKSIAAEVYMATLYTLSSKPNQKESQSQDGDPGDQSSTAGSGQFILPMRSSPQSVAERPVSQALAPQNTSSSSISQPNVSNGHSGSVELSPTTDPSAIRLSRYVHMDSPPPQLPARLSKILAHWEIGLDPAEYNWEATSERMRTVTRHGLQEAEEQRIREEEQQKRKERLLRKVGRKADGESHEQPRPSKQRVERGFASSQPKTTGRGFDRPDEPRGADSSQQIAIPSSTQAMSIATQQSQSQSQSQAQEQRPSLAVASQVEPGRFGGRGPLAVKKKPKRAQGFR
ncbi:MAG: hypothetical protein M1822_007923 [Bathelium mastoideum]|nr:MAG: hypothetical protein M1822_007923 [Bathelium mastoideum]